MSRTYDLAVFHQNAGEADTESMFLGGGRGLTGARKLAQRLLLELLTVRGSMFFAPARGTDLLNYVQQGRITSELDAHMYMQASLTQAEANLRSDEIATDPDDERILRTTIVEVTFEPGQLTYILQLETVAGPLAELTVPVDTLPRGVAA